MQDKPNQLTQETLDLCDALEDLLHRAQITRTRRDVDWPSDPVELGLAVDAKLEAVHREAGGPPEFRLRPENITGWLRQATTGLRILCDLAVEDGERLEGGS